jgi:FtsZ-binding cell division protein ZapB
MKMSKEALLTEIKKDSFQANVYLEKKLQPVINSSKIRNLGIKELDDIRNHIKSERRFLEDIQKELEKKKSATAKKDKFQEKFAYNKLKVGYFLCF